MLATTFQLFYFLSAVQRRKAGTRWRKNREEHLRKKKKVLTAKNLFQTENMRSKLTCGRKKKKKQLMNYLG